MVRQQLRDWLLSRGATSNSNQWRSHDVEIHHCERRAQKQPGRLCLLQVSTKHHLHAWYSNGVDLSQSVVLWNSLRQWKKRTSLINGGKHVALTFKTAYRASVYLLWWAVWPHKTSAGLLQHLLRSLGRKRAERPPTTSRRAHAAPPISTLTRSHPPWGYATYLSLIRAGEFFIFLVLITNKGQQKAR